MERSTGETFGELVMFCFFIRVLVKQVCVQSMKVHPAVHLCYMHLSLLYCIAIKNNLLRGSSMDSDMGIIQGV